MLDHRLLVNPPGGGVVTVRGSNVADGTPVTETSFVEDPAGYFALRVVDAAPFAYDEVDDVLKVRVDDHDAALATVTHASVNVTTASTEVVAANAARKYLLIQSNTNETIFLKFGAAAVANEGLLMLGRGSVIELSAAQGNLYRGAVNAIHAGVGDQAVLVTEGV